MKSDPICFAITIFTGVIVACCLFLVIGLTTCYWSNSHSGPESDFEYCWDNGWQCFSDGFDIFSVAILLIFVNIIVTAFLVICVLGNIDESKLIRAMGISLLIFVPFEILAIATYCFTYIVNDCQHKNCRPFNASFFLYLMIYLTVGSILYSPVYCYFKFKINRPIIEEETARLSE